MEDSDTSVSLAPDPAGEEGPEQDTPAELGRVAVAHCPGNANVIAHPFYLLKVTQVMSNKDYIETRVLKLQRPTPGLALTFCAL